MPIALSISCLDTIPSVMVDLISVRSCAFVISVKLKIYLIIQPINFALLTPIGKPTVAKPFFNI